MGPSIYDPGQDARPAWNAGRKLWSEETARTRQDARLVDKWVVAIGLRRED